MKKSIIYKILLFLMIFLMFTTSIYQVKALKDTDEGYKDIDIDEVTGGASDFIHAGEKIENPINDDRSKKCIRHSI